MLYFGAVVGYHIRNLVLYLFFVQKALIYYKVLHCRLLLFHKNESTKMKKLIQHLLFFCVAGLLEFFKKVIS